MDHVAFWMPMLVLAVSEDFYKLLQNSIVTSVASLRKACGIMIVAVDISIVLVVTVLRAKHGRTCRTCKVFNVIFSIQCSNIRASQGISAGIT